MKNLSNKKRLTTFWKYAVVHPLIHLLNRMKKSKGFLIKWLNICFLMRKNEKTLFIFIKWPKFYSNNLPKSKLLIRPTYNYPLHNRKIRLWMIFCFSLSNKFCNNRSTTRTKSYNWLFRWFKIEILTNKNILMIKA